MKPHLLNGLALADIGDKYYDLLVSLHLLNQGYHKVNDLHNKGKLFTSGMAQYNAISYLLENELLSDDEITYFKKGRNANGSQSRKSLTLLEYKKATGFESLIGYLYLLGEHKRIEELFSKIVDITIIK